MPAGSRPSVVPSQSVKVGDPVICHPLVSKGEALAARRGNDMHAGGAFPGIDSNGGYAELLKTAERAVIKLPQTLAPKDVAPYADAGLTAYHAAKKAARHLLPGDYVVAIGAGGSAISESRSYRHYVPRRLSRSIDPNSR